LINGYTPAVRLRCRLSHNDLRISPLALEYILPRRLLLFPVDRHLHAVLRPQTKYSTRSVIHCRTKCLPITQKGDEVPVEFNRTHQSIPCYAMLKHSAEHYSCFERTVLFTVSIIDGLFMGSKCGFPLDTSAQVQKDHSLPSHP